MSNSKRLVATAFILLSAIYNTHAQPENPSLSEFPIAPHVHPFSHLSGDTSTENSEYEETAGPHMLPLSSGICVPNTVNRFTGSWHSNLYIGNNAGTNVLLAWGQSMLDYTGTGSGNITSPTIVSAASYAGVPLEVRASSSGGASGLSALVLRTSTKLYVFGTAANLTAITSMANFGGAAINSANSDVTSKLPGGVLITDVIQTEISQTAFAILTSTGHVYVLTKVTNLQGDKAVAGPAIWHHVTLSDGTTFLSGITKISLSSSGVLAMGPSNKLYYWGSPANVAGVTNTVTSYNYAFDMSAQIPLGKTLKGVVCLGNKTPSTSTLFILCDDKKVYATGVNTSGCLGINNATTTFNQATFVTVKTTDGTTDLSNIVKIDGDTEGDLFCMGAISATGQVYGWGDSQAAMLGVNGAITSFSVPKTLQLFSPTPGVNFTDISVAGHFFIAFYSSGGTDQYWYLGHNIGGSIGNPANVTTFILAGAPASLNSSGGVTFECSNATLPLTWLSFTAQKRDATVLLKWTTAYEQNTRDFWIQHSTDGINWNTIAVKPAAGNSSQEEYYDYTHINPAKGFNYYRIIQLDIDGRSSYSSVVSVLFGGKDRLLQVFPTSIHNGIIRLQLSEAASVSVYSANGALLQQKQMAPGIQTIDASYLSAGVYFIKAGTETEKIIIY